MAIGYLHYMCSDIANYYEICRENAYFWRKDKLDLPLPFANSYDQSQLQPKSFNYIESWKNSITYAKYMWKMCICSGMRYLCTIHIIAAHTSTNKEHASPSMSLSLSIYIYIYIHIIYIIWLQWHSKHICALDVLIQHMAMAYATTMLPISQGALETSVSTWRRLFIIYYI